MVTGLLRALTRRQAEPEAPVEMLDIDTLRSRIGEPSEPKGEPAPSGARYVRADERQQPEERSWRKVAGLKR